ncbi:MAG: tetratricopeptide repeat protein [Bryobacteraceae bacterium]|nr:tetratricopeptide repeat protein [Bryobacteraceae bacterium]MDW8376794.1 tetratricopeptide repeat protein [Bryobacterales bacterium]
MKAFHARDFQTAKRLFEQSLSGLSREMAHVARLHIRMCEQRLNHSEPVLRTPDELYHYAVGLMNQRRLEEAEGKLRKALEAAPNSDYIHYALGIVCGLRGNLDEAAKHLSRAIEIDPRNRSLARSDQDFLEFGKNSPLRELVFGEKKEGE